MKQLTLLIFLFIFFSFKMIAQTCELKGMMKSNEGVPIPLMTIELNDSLHTQTSIDGIYSIELVYGVYTLKVLNEFYEPYVSTLEVNQEKITHNIVLTEQIRKIDELVLKVDRTAYYEKDVTGSQTHIKEKELSEQVAVSNNLNDVLSKSVTGMAPSTESASAFGQGLRGRNIAIFIDGVPQSTPLRGSGRVLRSIESSNIESIDVLRGASALYGYGATGGIIDFKTKSLKQDGFVYGGLVNTRVFPTKLNAGASYRLGQNIGYKHKKISIITNASYEQTSRYVDAEGDYIPVDPIGQGGTADNSIYNVFLKTSYELDTNQSVGLTYIFYQTEQNSNLKTLPGVVGESKSTVFSGEQEGLFPATINHNLSASYFHQNIWKETNFSFVTFYQNIKARFNYSDFFQGQSFIQSQKYGTRADFVSYLHPKLRVHYGVDFLSDQTEQGLEDGRVWMPLITQYSVAPFTQVKYDLTKQLLLKGGFRYEIASLNIPTFEGIQTKGIVEGGTINYQTPLVNASVLYKLHKYLKPSVSFSQGFSLADIGRVVRALDAPSIADLSLSAMVVNNYEVGLQGKFKHWEYFYSAYISTSALGSSYEAYPDIKVTRAPEQIYGTEASVNIQFLPKWTLKYSISYLEGKVDTDDNGSYDAYLNGTRIPPLTMNTALRFSPSKYLYAQIQTLYVGSRDRFENSTQAYEGKVVAYNTTDLLVGTKLWKGNLLMAINNVFNQFYFPSISQWVNTGEGYTAGVGVNFSVTYQYNLSQKK